jgi:hypothetical protein
MKKFLLLISIFLLSSCTLKQKQPTEQSDLRMSGDHYIIDLDGKKEISISFSDIFKNMRTIILETGNECMIGLIRELQVYNGYIYILDNTIAKSLFVFDIEGRFIRKIGSLGNGPGEYIYIDDFTLDTTNGFIFLLDYGTRIHKYQLNGTYIHSINIQEPRTNSKFIQYYNGRLYTSILAWKEYRNQNDYMLLEIDPNDGKVLSRSLPLKLNKGWSEAYFTDNFFMSRLNSPPRYTQLFMDIIVSLDEGITTYIEVKSKDLVTERDLENLPEGRSFSQRLMQLFQGSSKIWDVQGFVENDEFIIFKYACGDGWSKFLTVVVNKKTGSVKIAERLRDDFVLRNKNDNESVMSVRSGRFKFSDSKGAYEVITPNIFERFKESVKNNEIVPDLDKLDQLMLLDAESNPVIFFYEFK